MIGNEATNVCTEVGKALFLPEEVGLVTPVYVHGIQHFHIDFTTISRSFFLYNTTQTKQK